jgi:PAS domain S-box-containing protein
MADQLWLAYVVRPMLSRIHDDPTDGDDMPTVFDTQIASSIVAAMPVALTHCSADMRYLWVSDRCAAWYGRPVAEFIGKTLEEVVGEKAMAVIRPHVEAVLAGKHVEYEAEVPYEGIGPRWVHAEYAPTFDASGAVSGWVASLVDVTERKRAEESLSVAHTALARLFDISVMPGGAEAMPALLQAVVDTAIEITGADLGALQLYDEVNDCLRIAAHRGFGQLFLDSFAVVWRDSPTTCAEAIRRREQVIVEDVSTSPIFDFSTLAILRTADVQSVQSTLMVSREGRLLGVLSTLWKKRWRPDPDRLRTLEILARQAADMLQHRQQEDLLEANRRKDEFLAMLGHELRNPLAPILTATELMALHGAGPMEPERKMIEDQVKHLMRLVDDLLDVSRITRGKIELRKEPIALGRIVARAVEMASPLFEERSHRLAIDVAPELIVEADPARMVQVVANLLTNAARYTETGGDVRVKSEATEDTIVLRVTDTGVGISPTMLPYVFEPFVQEKQALNRPRGGLGLGLAIVRSLVQLHGGSASASSQGPGKGSEFAISLPRSQRTVEAPATEARSGRETAAAGTGIRVLVVDDNENLARALARGLEALGHEARTAHDGPSALRLVQRFTPALCLIDLGLPLMDGYELARRLRELPALSATRIVAISGYGEPVALQRSAAAGFAAHLVKPIELTVLEEMARSARPS